MPVETAADRKAMLADFGVDVRFKPASSGSSIVKGIFDNIYMEVEAGGTSGIATSQPRLFCSTSDISGAREDDEVTVAGVLYVIRVVMSDGLGMSELVLEKQ